MKNLILLFFILTLAFSACGGGGGEGGEVPGDFWVIDFRGKGSYKKIEAEPITIGTYCDIWVEKGRNIDKTTIIDKIQEKYEETNGIYDKMVANFSVSGPIKIPGTTNDFGGKPMNNILEFADYWGNEDGKLTILIYNIPDDDPYSIVQGYFTDNDIYPTTRYSNKRDMIYMNAEILTNTTQTTAANIAEFCSTLAHEVQHLMNFATSLYTRAKYQTNGDIISFKRMDTWVDEGLSAAAQRVYSGVYDSGRLDWYNKAGMYVYSACGHDASAIPYGNNFFVWESNGFSPDTHGHDYTLDDYATVYLFFQWLRLQAGGGNGIYRDIIISTEPDFKAVVNAVKGKGNYNNTYDVANLNWETLLQDWLIANALNMTSGKYGYMGDATLKNITFHYLAVGAAGSGKWYALPLLPGEGVCSYTSGNYSGNLLSVLYNSKSPSIKHIAVNKTALTWRTTNFYDYGYLISFNKNDNKAGKKEDGVVFNIYPNEPINGLMNIASIANAKSLPAAELYQIKEFPLAAVQPQAELFQADKPFKPQPISAEDMLRRIGHGDGDGDGDVVFEKHDFGKLVRINRDK